MLNTVNRKPKQYPMKSTKNMKKESRGAIDDAFDENSRIVLVRWKDNAVVILASNKLAVVSIQKTKRWSVAEIDQSFLVQRYNAKMGGTGKLDQNVSC